MAKVLSINTFCALMLIHFMKMNGCLLHIQSLHYKAAFTQTGSKGKVKIKAQRFGLLSQSSPSLPPTVSQLQEVSGKLCRL